MPQKGTFDTEEKRPWNAPRQEAMKDVHVDPSLPNVAVGFSSLDADKNHNLRAKAYIDNLKGDGFKFHIDSWSDSVLYRATAN